MKKILIVLALLMLAGCSRQVLPEEQADANPQIKDPSTAPVRYVDNYHGVACYWLRGYDAISCVKL
ncbi:hypothetical protein PP761_gp09 [Stenotrophomonas phage Paxi]|uniref:Lipoprotein n=1 Tax=Stenotrophomonas phage Paxi TaxID=2859653 RepID=A0AAE8BHQ9_9CAUD|nr:hypothetical protein PP761_gp09 [Stenotrophomonas phage Paxi]QYW01780.1 hypothetical protein CPT_Paxi_009 [Stenotrophomonas phage Paxi]